MKQEEKKALLARLKKHDIKRANALCKQKYGVFFKQPANISRVLHGERGSTIEAEFLLCLLEIVENREAIEKQLFEKIETLNLQTA